MTEKNSEAGNKAVAAAATVATAAAAQAPKAQPKSNRTVTVACKIPNGLIIQCYDMVDSYEPVYGGGQRPMKKAQAVGNPITLTGPARPINSDPELKRVVGGYGLTFGVNADYFNRWCEENKMSDVIRNGLVFAEEKDENAVAKAKDMKAVRSGLEPLNPDSRKPDGTHVDPRMKGLKNVRKLNMNENVAEAN
jgi:hypothetical protein